MKKRCDPTLTPFALMAAVFLTGCARYEYLLMEPNRFAGIIGKQELRVDYEPLKYRLAAKEDHLSLTVSNPLDSPVTLVGSRSYVVDPAGQTRPLHGGTIAPRSYIAMMLPPQAPVYRASPTFNVGLGFGYSSYDHYSPHFSPGFGYYPDPFYYSPTYYYLDSPDYWGWKTGQVQLRLFYEHANTNTFEHHFIFLRQKVKR